MSLLRVLPIIYAYLFSAVQIPSANAIHPQALSRQTTILNKPSSNEPSLFLHSNQLSSRDSPTDICATIDLGLLAELEPLFGFRLPAMVSTSSHHCLCLNNLDFYLDTNTDLTLMAAFFERETFLTYLQILIKTSPKKQECAQMPGVYNTRSDFNLCQMNDRNSAMSTTRVTQVDDSCVCAASLSFCDRVCGLAEGCSSLVSHASKSQKSENLYCRCADETICEANKTVYDEFGNENNATFSRADVETTVESRGGYLHSLSTVQPSTDMGIDCYRVPHIEKVQFVDGECVVKSCAPGWVLSVGGGACIRQPRSNFRMRRVKSRNSSADRVILDIHVVIDLAQLFRSLNGLRLHSDSLHNSSTKEAPVTPIAVEDIFQAATEIVLSRTLGSLLVYTGKLLNVARRADGMLRDYEISENQKFDQIRDDVETIMALTTDILDWYRALSGENGTLDTISSEIPITVSLDQLFDHLGLRDLKTVIKLGEFGSELTGLMNGLVNDLTIGPDDHRSQLGADSGIYWLVAQVEGLIGLVLQLGDLNSFRTLKTSSPVNLGAMAPVSLATLGLMSSTRISDLSSGTDLLDLASTEALMVLSSCGDCDTIVDRLNLIVEAARTTKGICKEFSPADEIDLPFTIPTLKLVSPHDPISVFPAHTSTADAIRRSKGAPVVIVLDGLLHNIGLAGVTGNISVGGLDGRVSGMLNGVVSLLKAGERRSVRREGVTASPAMFGNPEFVKVFTTAVESAIDLESKSAGSEPLANLLAGVMQPVLASLQAVLGAPTVTGVILAVDELLGGAKVMEKTLTGCNCTDSSVLESSGRFVAAVENVQKWVDEHPSFMKTE